MADLLSSSDREDIFASFSDLADTFFQYSAAFQIRKRALSPFNEDVLTQYSVTEKSVRCFQRPESTGDGAKNDTFQHGSADFTEGYVLCFITDLIEATLATATNIDVKAGLDTVKIDGLEFDILGTNLVGPLKQISTDRFVLAKFHIKKKLQKNG